MSDGRQFEQEIEELRRANAELTAARDEAEFANAEQSRFFAAMTHEMRTPLNGVATALELIEDGGLPADTLEMLEIARNAASNLQHVVNDVLDWSRLQSGGFELVEGRFAPDRALRVALQIVSSPAQKKGLELNLESNCEDLYLLGDDAKIQQTTINLMSNAIKFTEKGSVTVRLHWDEASSLLEVSVQDTGPGIPEEIQESVFQPFWTSRDSSFGTLSRGTGLGLSICVQLVEIMGGEVGLESKVGEGSRFWFRVPCKLTDPPVEREAGGTSTVQYFGKVLLVDDDPTNQYLSRLLLERRGLAVETAGNGQEAIDQVLSGEFDLVFMDVSMPVMDGPTATGILRESFSAESLPIIALTAHASDSDRQRFLGLGMNDTVVKPISQANLDAVLGRHLAGAAPDLPPPAPPQDATTHDSFDRNAMVAFRDEIGERAWCRVAGIFENDARTKIERIRSHMESSTLPEVRNDAHSLHSMAVSLGCVGLGQALKQLELILTEGQPVEMQHAAANRVLRIAPTSLDRLALELARVEAG